MSVEREIWGWAWADGGVTRVQIRASDETECRSAHLEALADQRGSAFPSRGPRGTGVPCCSPRARRPSVATASPSRGGADSIHGIPANVV